LLLLFTALAKKNVKTALANFDTFKYGYNPYRLKEQADDSGFGPYFLIDVQEAFYMPEDEDDGGYQEIDKIQEPVDKTEGLNNADKTEDTNNNTNKTTDMYCDPFQNTNTTVPISERLIPAATSTAGSVANNVLWGAMAAVHCVSNGKKTVDNYCKDYNKIRNAPLPPRDCYTLFDDRENDAAINDTPSLCDNNPDMVQVSEEVQKRRERKLAEREAIFKKIASYGGKHTRYPIDETWGFIESDYTVQFKVSFLSLVYFTILSILLKSI
jgi:hypothetical protein